MSKVALVTILFLVCLFLIDGLSLYAMGHSVICPCGYVQVWENRLDQPGNSQQILDWYSVLHFLYGMIAYFVALVLNKRFGWKMMWLFYASMLIALGWELFENTYYVAGHYHISSFSPAYFGDSIINSLSDIFVFALGFWLASLMPFWIGITFFLSIIIVTMILTSIFFHKNLFVRALSFSWSFKNPFAVQQGKASVAP